MKIERAIANVETLGPGKRICIWTVGCKRRCPGCVSERLQSDIGAIDYVIEEFLDGFNFKKANGVTISGGEPFEQVEELNHLIDYLIANSVEDILVYTGYTLEELKNKNNLTIDSILSKIAVLIDGPYIQELDYENNNLKGSENQKIHFLNEKYKSTYLSYLSTKRSMQELDAAHMRIGMGIPTKEYIEEFKK